MGPTGTREGNIVLQPIDKTPSYHQKFTRQKGRSKIHDTYKKLATKFKQRRKRSSLFCHQSNQYRLLKDIDKKK